MNEKKVTVQIGPGLPALLFITFLVLKMTGYIAWSWWWVTAPLWISFGVFLAVFAFVFFVAIIWAILKRG